MKHEEFLENVPLPESLKGIVVFPEQSWLCFVVPVYEHAGVRLIEGLVGTSLGIHQLLLVFFQCTHAELPAFSALTFLLLQEHIQTLPEPDRSTVTQQVKVEPQHTWSHRCH